MPEKLKHSDGEQIRRATMMAMEDSWGKVAAELFEEIGLGHKKVSRRYFLKLISLSIDAIDTLGSKMKKLTDKFCDDFEELLELFKYTNITEDVETYVNFMANQISDRIFYMLIKNFEKCVNTIIISPSIKKMDKNTEEFSDIDIEDIDEAFQLFDLKPGASQKEIKRAWKKLQIENHSGRNLANSNHSAILPTSVKIDEAYETLKNINFEFDEPEEPRNQSTNSTLKSKSLLERLKEFDRQFNVADIKDNTVNKRKMEILSEFLQVAFELKFVGGMNQINTSIIGTEFLRNGGKPIPLIFKKRSATSKGRFELPTELKVRVNYASKRSSFYVAVAAYLSHIRIPATPELLWKIAVGSTTTRVKGSTPQSANKVFKNRFTKKMYANVKNRVQVEGEKDNRYTNF
jgi:curved DNA-binding protein CbpA